MKHKIFIGWVITFISIFVLTLVFWFSIGISIVLAIMVPIEVGVLTTVIPVVIIDKKVEFGRKVGDKGKVKKKSQDKTIKEKKPIEEKVKETSEITGAFIDSSHEIQIIGEEEITKDPVKILVGDVEVLEMPSEKNLNSSYRIMIEHFNNEELLNVFDNEDSLMETINLLNNFELASFSKEFFEKLDELELSEQDRLDFIKDMMIFSPSERMEFLSDMIKKATCAK